LLALVRDLLDLAHAQRPSLHLVPQPVALAGTLETTLEIQRERAGLKGVILEVDDLFDIVVMADADDVTHIFANLIDNAVKYTPSGGRVEVKVSRHGGLVGVEITDTGIGVDEADRERVFRGFFRTEAAKASGEKGTGVGLSIVRRLVQRWQGHVELDSSGGSGCRFRVLLPAAEEVDHA
jgi:signal transduction histidine kinase